MVKIEIGVVERGTTHRFSSIPEGERGIYLRKHFLSPLRATFEVVRWGTWPPSLDPFLEGPDNEQALQAVAVHIEDGGFDTLNLEIT